MKWTWIITLFVIRIRWLYWYKSLKIRIIYVSDNNLIHYKEAQTSISISICEAFLWALEPLDAFFGLILDILCWLGDSHMNAQVVLHIKYVR